MTFDTNGKRPSGPRSADPCTIATVEDEHPTVGRRDRKRRATREALALAALELFEDRGFAATTIDDITERADLARRTFFRHFPSKEAVLFPDSEDYERMLVSAFEEAPPERLTLEGLVRMFAAAAHSSSHDDLHRRRLAVIADNQIEVGAAAWDAFVTLRSALATELAAHYHLPDDDPTLQLGVTLGLFVAAEAFARWTTDGTDESQFGTEILDLFGSVASIVDGTTVLGTVPHP